MMFHGTRRAACLEYLLSVHFWLVNSQACLQRVGVSVGLLIPLPLTISINNRVHKFWRLTRLLRGLFCSDSRLVVTEWSSICKGYHKTAFIKDLSMNSLGGGHSSGVGVGERLMAFHSFPGRCLPHLATSTGFFSTHLLCCPFLLKRLGVYQEVSSGDGWLFAVCRQCHISRNCFCKGKVWDSSSYFFWSCRLSHPVSTGGGTTGFLRAPLETMLFRSALHSVASVKQLPKASGIECVFTTVTSSSHPG